MGSLKNFDIKFEGLKVGGHQFDFKVDKAFFEELEYSEVHNGNVDVDVTLLKESNLMVLEFGIKGTVEVDCDRCLEPLNQPVKGNYRLIVKFGNEAFEETDEIVVIPDSEYKLNVAQYIYEYICLSLPMRRTHAKGKCDPEVLKKLKELSSDSNNTNNDEPDPRWKGLEDLFVKSGA